MTAPRRRPPKTAIAGTLLILAGLVCWALYVKTSGDEPHAYARSGAPPRYVQVEIGKTYRIAIRGGVAAVAQAGVDIGSLQCTAAAPGAAPGALNLFIEDVQNTKATNDIAGFVAAKTGRLHVACSGLGPVFVDNAEDAAFDWSGVWLVLASIALLIGIPLILSALRSAGRGPVASVPADVGRIDPAAEEIL